MSNHTTTQEKFVSMCRFRPEDADECGLDCDPNAIARALTIREIKEFKVPKTSPDEDRDGDGRRTLMMPASIRSMLDMLTAP